MGFTIKDFDANTDIKYLPALKALADEGLSTGYFTDEVLNGFKQGKYFCTMAIDDSDKLLGINYGRFETKEEIAEMMRCTVAEVETLFKGEELFFEQIGMVISKSARGLGLSKIMMSRFKDGVFTKVNTSVTGLWIRNGDEEPIVRLEKSAGSVFLKRIPDYWYDDPDLYCDVCKGRCHCNCDIYYVTKENFRL